MLLKVDETRVEQEFNRTELAFELSADFVALVGSGCLVGRTRSDVRADVVYLVANVAMQLGVLSTE